jgi:tetratricopeptide (TPR) repeat protein
MPCSATAVGDPSPLNPREIGALVALIDQERLAEAERRARALLRLHPNAGMLWKILSVTLVRQGKDALQALRRTTDLMPTDTEAHCNLGAALYDRGQWAESLVSLRRVLGMQPNHVEALVDAANALKALGRAEEAVALYQRALQVSPALEEAHNNLGNALLELRRYEEAAACYRRALRIRPDDAQILCNLGNAERQLGRLDEALASTRQAIALDATLVVAHNNLGLMLAARGEREQAVASYRRALSLDPGYVDAHNNLGDALRDLGLRREALSHYTKATELDPGGAASHCNVGTVLFELRRITDAVASYRKALALDPRYAPAHLSLALALRQQRRPAEAESSCRAALSIDPDYAEALAFLGELLADRGRFAEAEKLFEQVIALDPNSSSAYSSIATHRKMTLADSGWRQSAEALLERAPPLGQEIGLRYALGKYFDDIGAYQEAFQHYERANDLTKRYGAKYERAGFTQLVDQLIRSFDGPFMHECRTAASTSELPVFIIGMPRSGTSLAEQILASHPAVFGAGEVTFWNTAYRAYHDAELAARVDPDQPARVAREYLEYLEQLALTGGGAPQATAAERMVDKMPANFLYAGLIHAAFPKARIIHMQRHPIDTCLSIYFQNFFNIGPYANDLHDLVHFFGEYVRITHHWRTVLPQTALLAVPYEGLIEDPEHWSRRMVEFIGLPWDPRCLEFHLTERVVLTASKWQVRQKITKSSAGRWRNYEQFLGPLRGLA